MITEAVHTLTREYASVCLLYGLAGAVLLVVCALLMCTGVRMIDDEDEVTAFRGMALIIAAAIGMAIGGAVCLVYFARMLAPHFYVLHDLLR